MDMDLRLPTRKVVNYLLLTSALIVGPTLAEKNYGPGVTDTEIKLGQTMPYSGPLSGIGTTGRVELAYFTKINSEGGVNGRKITLISLDDAYAGPETAPVACAAACPHRTLRLPGTKPRAGCH
jgi:ABC-type branched-subunit amino acid transport system substrate-binding protein